MAPLYERKRVGLSSIYLRVDTLSLFDRSRTLDDILRIFSSYAAEVGGSDKSSEDISFHPLHKMSFFPDPKSNKVLPSFENMVSSVKTQFSGGE